MALVEEDLILLDALQGGLPITSEPYKVIAEKIGMTEMDVLDRLQNLLNRGILKRFGIIVRHHELGYCCNGMCVWEIPNNRLVEIGDAFSAYDFVTLCYERPKRLPDWPYNLFCMIHGKERNTVLEQAERLARENGLMAVKRDILFSTKRFKQRGAHYGLCKPADIKLRELA
jgi:siroheme decarboxylase